MSIGLNKNMNIMNFHFTDTEKFPWLTEFCWWMKGKPSFWQRNRNIRQ
jgi:hypothetical protein